MKRIVAILTVLVLTCLGAGFAEAPDFMEQFSAYLETATEQEMVDMLDKLIEAHDRRFPAATAEATEAPTYSASFNQFDVEYLGASVEQSDGESYIKINYRWTNKTDNANSFTILAGYTAYQNGVQLDAGYLPGVETDEFTSVLPGYSTEVSSVHKLSNTTDPVVLQVSAFADFMDTTPPLEVTINLP